MLYAMDRQWWRAYGEEAHRVFGGEFVAPLKLQGVRHVRFRPCKSSGEGAVALAAHWGARRIILLGFDCQHTGGKAHWHPDHRGMGNAKNHAKWPAQFRALASFLGRSVEVVNATRETALNVFPRMTLEQALYERAGSRIAEGAAACAA